MNPPEVFILILNYNGWRDTVECLESVQRLTYPNYHIVVIDNDSTDGSMEKIKTWAAGELPVESKFFTYDPATKPVRWIEYDRATAEAGGLPELEAEIEARPSNRSIVLIQTWANLGYAGGNNVGIRYALARGAEYVWLLNNDTVVDKDALTEMVSLAEGDEIIGVVGAKLLYYDRPDIIQCAGGGNFNFWQGLPYMYGWLHKDDGRWDIAFEPGYVSGACLFSRSNLFREIGLMDESFFMYAEDTDWSIRAKRRGWKLCYCPKAKIWHRENASTGYKSPLVEYYSTRNALRLVRRYYPWRLPVVVFFHLLRVGRRAVTRRWRRSFAVLRGILSGIFMEV